MNLSTPIHTAINGIRYFYIYISCHFDNLGWPVIFSSGVEIECASAISIGKKSKLGKDVWIRAEKNGIACIKIGDGVDIGRRSFISCAKLITIGDNCLFGPNITIVDHNHAYENVRLPISSQGISDPHPVRIDNDCWIGSNVVILPGTIIGKHCIIGANTVLSGKIANFSVVAGNPPKLLKKYSIKKKKWLSVHKRKRKRKL